MTALPVRVLPRLDAQERIPEAREVCISVTNPRQSLATLRDGWFQVLRLGFHDTDRRGGNFTVMSLAQARDVLDFSRGHAGAPLTVHCEAGASRSVAIGVFLAAWLSRPLLLKHDVLAPNPWVIRQLRLAALRQAVAWHDGPLFRTAVCGPLAARYRVLPAHIADTYLD